MIKDPGQIGPSVTGHFLSLKVCAGMPENPLSSREDNEAKLRSKKQEVKQPLGPTSFAPIERFEKLRLRQLTHPSHTKCSQLVTKMTL